ncbi:hypothetical protein [Salinifilum ghardaiensis]
MAEIDRHHDPTSLMLRALSERECARFKHRNLQQPGRGRAVHAVEFRAWIAGLHLPAPACHQPTATLALTGEAQAVRAKVTCTRCQNLDPGAADTLVPLDGGLPLQF